MQPASTPRLLALLCCVLALPALADTKPPPVQSEADLGFSGDTRANTLAHFKRVGILPLQLPAGFTKREDVSAAVESLVSDYLRRAGFDVVGSAGYSKIRDELNHRVGGVYDPVSGNVKREQWNAVQTNALRESVETERLDGFVAMGISSRKAFFTRDSAQWDGVSERTTGRLPGNAVVEFFNAGSNNMTGTLPGYSVAVEIVNTEGKMIWSRYGAIQLAAYADTRKAKGAINSFLFVKPDDLFKDHARLERAVRIATLPLVHTPEEIAAGNKDPLINAMEMKSTDLPPPPEGEPRSADSGLKVDRDKILTKVHRVAMFSIDTREMAPPKEVLQRYMDLVRAELGKLGWTVIDAPNGRDLLAAEYKKQGPFFDPYTGERDEAKVIKLRQSVYAGLGLDPAPDAVLISGFTKVQAPHMWGDAEWDGVSQSGVDLGPVRKKLFGGSANVGAGEGSLQALSFYVTLRDMQDTELYDTRGGIQLLQQLRGKEKTNLTPGEMFKDPSRDEPAVHAAFRELVLTPEQIDAELHPEKAKAPH
ncbi:MAG TPA: hypothetical protein VLW26_02220 [Steroidobacteraceae bacterium]|nr:hypothetical protein [Steroidobacteraceae bacterium]